VGTLSGVTSAGIVISSALGGTFNEMHNTSEKHHTNAMHLGKYKIGLIK